MTEMPCGFKPLFRVECDVGEIRSLGQMPMGERRVVSIDGGRILPAQAGGAPAGAILAGGADWQWIRSDGIAEIAAHYTVLTDDGDHIEVDSSGYRHGPPEVIARLARGDAVAASEYYFRTAMRFRTNSARPQVQRLNGVLAFAIGERRPAQVLLSVYELL